MNKVKEIKETPLMAQYNKIKGKYPDAILLFRVGDFYETFEQDAVTTSKVLGIVLTRRANGSASFVELAGFPYHSLDNYLPKLVKAGYRVAICDQLEDPKLTKTIVKRGVTEMITPGVTDNEKLLDHRANNFLCSIHFDGQYYGLAFLDISTGEFYAAQGNAEYADKMLQSLKPSEVIFSKSFKKDFATQFGSRFYTYAIEDWIFQFDYTNELLLRHFQVLSLKGFGIDEMKPAIIACGAALQYLSDTEHPNIGHITSISRIEEEKYVWLDRFTIRNLELLQCQHEHGKSLLQVMDHTLSPMGSRMMRKWVVLPLKDKHQIEERLEMVKLFILETELLKNLQTGLKQAGDLERLIARVPLGKINPREVIQLRRSLISVEKLINDFQSYQVLQNISGQLNPCLYIREKVEKTLQDEAPAVIQKGGVIKNGVSVQLDEYRNLAYSGKEYLLQIQKEEIEKTGITSLKIGFNNIHGYYLEVTNTHKNRVPADWIRKQTLVSAERYVTPALKEYEEKILGAEEKILQLEQQLFTELVNELNEYVQIIQLNASVLARLDCLQSFATLSLKHNYHKPLLDDSFIIDIKDGRHPVIEQQLPLGEQYVPNDIFLDNESQQIIIITGPNMAGKSALIRQTALIVLMAQMGCFVPATSARIGRVDKIFTRVGASDNISSGESTFMVEMSETASILNNISERSLILLDEIGRGTSTFDGISIAWAIAEYLHTNTKGKPKTLFATHYHELNELEEKFPRIKNFNVSIRESGNKIIFLRKLVEGGSQHSFGIHVAKIAGIPTSVVDRANDILSQMELKTIGNDLKKIAKEIRPKEMQLSIFEAGNPKFKKIKEQIEQIEINTMTPVEALLKLHELKKCIEE